MNKKHIDSWIDIAIKDLEASKVLYNSKLYSNSFYHFQQASEKGIKAYAFMADIFTNEEEARRTSHYILKIFKDSAVERYEEIALLKEFEFDKFLGSKIFDKYSSDIKNVSSELPNKNQTFEYSNKTLNDILKTLRELKEYKPKYPKDFKFFFVEKMNIFFDLAFKDNPEKREEAKNGFNDFIKNENDLDELIKISKNQFNNNLIEHYYVLILFYSNLISHTHNNIARYPEKEFNPLKYYTMRKAIIKKLPEFSHFLKSSLMMLKKWNNLNETM